MFERYQFVNEHPAYTYAAYDNAKASDIALDREFKAMLAPMPKGGG